MNTILAAKERLNVNNLPNNERKSLIKKVYADQSYFALLFHKDSIEIDSHQHSIAFRDEIERILLERLLIKEKFPLEKLHELLSDDMKVYDFDSGISKISTFFYETDESFLKVYHQFIKFLRWNFVQEPFWFQATPTIRIHCPNAKNNHHYPRYHSDICYGHPPEEMNIWIPLTHLMGVEGHSFRTMSIASSNDVLSKVDYDLSAFIHHAVEDKEFSNYCESLAKPVTTEFGKMLAFDSRVIHSGEPMQTHTRISMDIRIIPLSRYEKMNFDYQGSGRRKILFTPGNCYHIHDSDHI